MYINYFKCLFTSFLLCIALTVSSQTLTPQKDARKAQWGYVDASGKWVVKPKYSSAGEFKEMPNGKVRALVEKDGLKGFIDEKGTVLGPGVVFQDITPLYWNTMLVTVKDKKGVMDYDCVYLVKPEMEIISELGKEGRLVSIKGKLGILKDDGSWLLEPVYKNIKTSIPDYFVVNKDGKAGLLKRDGSVVIAAKEYTGLSPLCGNNWVIEKGKKSGVIDISSENIILKPKYKKVVGQYLDGKVIIAVKGDYIKIYDPKGKELAHTYGDATTVASVEEDNKNNAILIHKRYGWPYIYNHDYERGASLEEVAGDDFHGFTRNKYKLIDSFVQRGSYSDNDLKILKPYLDGYGAYSSTSGMTEYTSGKELNDKLFLMRKNDGDKYDLFVDGSFVPIQENLTLSSLSDPVNFHGWIVIDENAISPDMDLYKGKMIGGKTLIIENKAGKYNLVDNNGMITDFEMEDAKLDYGHILDYGYVLFKKNGLWGILKGDEILIEPQYKEVENFTKYYYLLRGDDKTALYDKKLKEQIPVEEVNPMGNDYLAVKSNGLWGICKDGIVIPFKYREKPEQVTFVTGDKKEVSYFKMKDTAGHVGLMDVNDFSWYISPENGYSDIEGVEIGSYTYHTSEGALRYDLRVPSFIVKKNGKYGVLVGDKEVMRPICDKIEMSKYGRSFKAKVTKNGATSLYRDSFDKELKPYIDIEKFFLWKIGGFGGCARIYMYNPNMQYMNVNMKVYHYNGTPAKGWGGKPLEDSRKVYLDEDGDGSYDDGIIWDTSNLRRGEYYITLTVTDPKGRLLKKCDEKVYFSYKM